MSNAAKFLRAYNSIDDYLRRSYDGDRSLSFARVVYQLSATDEVVRRFHNDLRQYAELRNAIVHDARGAANFVIAEPHESTVRRIEHIEKLLRTPPKVLPQFAKNVFTVAGDDLIAVAVRGMFVENISQVPVVDGNKFVGLLTSNTVARWLGTCAGDEIFSLDTPVKKVLQYDEDKNNVAFLAREATLFDALAEFGKAEKTGRRLEAILITQNSKPHERILGIITIYDVPEILSEVERD